LPLFIDRLPFDCWIDQTRTPPAAHWSVVLPVFVSDPNLSAPPPNAPLQRWVLDTGNRGAAFAWRRHLLDAGIDPDVLRFAGGLTVTTAVGGKTPVPVRMADLWLASNVPALGGAAWRIELDPGIPFNDVTTLPDPQFHRPLIGLRALRRAGLRVELDFAADVVSVWTP
jgi:hypothetical protein